MFDVSEELSELKSPWSLIRDGLWRGWLCFGLLYFLLDQGRQTEPDYIELLVRSVLWMAVGLLCSWLLSFMYEVFQPEKQKRIFRDSVVLLGGFCVLAAVMAVSGLLLDGVIQFSCMNIVVEKSGKEQFFVEFADAVFVSLSWHSIALGLAIQYQSFLERERTLCIEKAAEKAKLASLRQQLNPHFLFNSLNSVIALIPERPSEAEQMLIELSVFLRHVLDRGMEQRIPLREELAFVHMYLAIEHIRFPDKLIYQETLSVPSQSVYVPSFLLQPFVENAIVHGMKTSEMPLQVHLIVQKEDLCLIIELKNTGSLSAVNETWSKVDEKVHSIPIILDRLRLEFGERYHFHLEEKDGWVCMRLEIQMTSHLEYTEDV